jgi:hypothetical protein
MTFQSTDHWQEHPDYPVEDWQEEVSNGETRLGYWEWTQVKDSERKFNEVPEEELEAMCREEHKAKALEHYREQLQEMRRVV